MNLKNIIKKKQKQSQENYNSDRFWSGYASALISIEKDLEKTIDKFEKDLEKAIDKFEKDLEKAIDKFENNLPSVNAENFEYFEEGNPYHEELKTIVEEIKLKHKEIFGDFKKRK